MSKFNVHKWRAGLQKRKQNAEKLDAQFIQTMERSGWLWLEQASSREDMVEKFDHWMVNRQNKFCKVDFKTGGVRDDHVQYWKKHGKSHGVTHYAFGTVTPRGDLYDRVRVMTVKAFMSKAVRRRNSKSGEYFWVLP